MIDCGSGVLTGYEVPWLGHCDKKRRRWWSMPKSELLHDEELETSRCRSNPEPACFVLDLGFFPHLLHGSGPT